MSHRMSARPRPPTSVRILRPTRGGQPLEVGRSGRRAVGERGVTAGDVGSGRRLAAGQAGGRDLAAGLADSGAHLPVEGGRHRIHDHAHADQQPEGQPDPGLPPQVAVEGGPDAAHEEQHKTHVHEPRGELRERQELGDAAGVPGRPEAERDEHRGPMGQGEGERPEDVEVDDPRVHRLALPVEPASLRPADGGMRWAALPEGGNGTRPHVGSGRVSRGRP